MKKAKEVNTLFNFNAHDNDDKIKNKKKNKKTKNSTLSKSKKTKKDNSHAEQISTFDFNNEIVIGLTKIDDDNIGKKDKKSNSKSKKSKRVKKVKQKNKTSNNSKKSINRESEVSLLGNKKNKDKSIKNNKSLLKKKTKKKNNNSIILDNQNEQDLIFDLKDDNLEISGKKNNKKKKTKTKKKHSKAFKIVSIISLFIIAIVSAMMSPLFNIKEIIVQGNKKISSEEIISLSQIQNEENLYRINARKARRGILENPYMQEATIKRQLPNKIIIDVEERKATFLIEDGSGYAYINNQGYVLEISEEKLELPIIQGAETEIDQLQPGKRLCVADLNKMTTVIKIMEIAKNNEINSLITRIDIENSQNFKILFETEEKVANLGDDTDLNTKILTIKSILDKEKDVAGEIFVNMDLNTSYPTFRQSV